MSRVYVYWVITESCVSKVEGWRQTVASRKLLVATPYPKTIIAEYYSQISPTFCDGFYSGVMTKLIDAIRELTEHKNQSISGNSKDLCTKAEATIAKERKFERRQNMPTRQSFE